MISNLEYDHVGHWLGSSAFLGGVQLPANYRLELRLRR
jgi:hypothetical protein